MTRGPFEHLTRFRQETSGAVAVEFVLIAPMLIALLFGIVTMGYFMGLSHSVQQLAAGAARASVAGLDEAERRSLAVAYLDEAGTNYPLLKPEGIDSTLTFGSGPSMTVSLSYATQGTMLEVANGYLGLNVTTINGSAYVAY